MRIYFEDNEERLSIAMFGIVGPYHIVDAAYGPTACKHDLDWYNRICPQDRVYTNYLGAMSFDYSWDKEHDKCECYIRNTDGSWVNIQDLTTRKLQFGHDIPKMYMAGEFKKD